MIHARPAPTICPLCRALTRLKIQMVQIEEPPDRVEVEKLFTTGCWIIAALERTSPCGAHRKTLREARRFGDELARLVEEAKEA